MISCVAVLLCALCGQPAPPSTEKIQALGRGLAAETARYARIVDDRLMVGYVNGIARKIASECGYGPAVEAQVLLDRESKAFSFPGGFLFVSSGSIRNMESEAELAGVLAQLAALASGDALLRSGAPGTLIFMGGWDGSAKAVPMGYRETYRMAVLAADDSGLRCLAKVGYDPREYVRHLSRAAVVERRETAQAVMNTLEAKDDYLVDTSEFSAIRQRAQDVEESRR